jgi:hypothetical protein
LSSPASAAAPAWFDPLAPEFMPTPATAPVSVSALCDVTCAVVSLAPSLPSPPLSSLH